MHKVVHITTVHNRWDNRIYFKECKALHKQGFDVYLIAPLEQGGQNKTMDFVNYVPLPVVKNRLLRLFLSQVIALRKMLKIKAKIYHFHDPELLFLAFFMRLIGKNVIFDMHENVPFQILNKQWINKYLRKTISILYRGVERLILPFISVIFAEKSYIQYYPYIKSKIDILNMPDLELLIRYQSEKSFEQRERAISYVGGITRDRGIDTIIDALIIINENKPLEECVFFHLIGAVQDGIIKDRITQHEWIIYHGFMPVAEAFKKVAVTRLSVALLKDIPNYRGSYSTKIFEYMAVGVPCIYSDFEIYKELFGDATAGWPLVPDNPKTLAALIEQVIDNVPVLMAESNKGILLAKNKLSWEVESKKLVEFYEERMAK